MGGPIQTIDSGERMPSLSNINSDYQIELRDRIIGVDTSAGPIQITLATNAIESSGGNKTYICVIKDETGDAATNNITLVTEGSETIDGDATKVINTNYGSLGVYNDGNNWFTL